MNENDILVSVPLNRIRIASNVRKKYDLDKIKELSSSIKNNGLLQPICIRQVGKLNYELVFGHRRFKALKLLAAKEPKKYKVVKAFVKTNTELKEDSIHEVQIIENIQRENLSFVELKEALLLLKDKGLTHKNIASRIGKKEGYVKNLFMAVKALRDSKELEKFVSKNENKLSFTDLHEVSTLSVTDKIDVLKEKLTGNITSKEALRQRVKELQGKVAPQALKENISIDNTNHKLRFRAFSVDISKKTKSELSELRSSLAKVIKAIDKEKSRPKPKPKTTKKKRS